MNYLPTRKTKKLLRLLKRGTSGEPNGDPAKRKIFVDPDDKGWGARLTLIFSLASLLAAGWFVSRDGWWPAGAALGLSLFFFGLHEMVFQRGHTLVRIYGPLGRLRYLFESEFRDKYLQYFNETNTDGRPFPRIVRDYVYQKSHGVRSLASFGTELSNQGTENTVGGRILHRNFAPVTEFADYLPTFEVVVGAKRPGVRPFVVRNCLNVSAMSFGSLNQRSCEAISLGSLGLAYANTGEGGYGPHGIAGNDIVFQLGTGKFGVGKFVDLPDGRKSRALEEDLLRDLTRDHDNIGLIQIKISQGAKPGLGGHLPGGKVTPEIAAVRRVPVGKTVISPSRHLELAAATEKESVAKLMDFCARIRELTERPVGIKICLGNPAEVDLLVEAMVATGEGPDAIQVDGKDGGTGAAPNLFLNYVGYGESVESMGLLHRKLTEAGIRDRVSLSVSGKLLTPAHAARAFAAGAEWIDSARGIMLALGCIQSLKCHTNECPTGIATNQPWRRRALDVREKATRVHRYLAGYHHDLFKLTSIMGHADPRDIRPEDVRLVSAEVV